MAELEINFLRDRYRRDEKLLAGVEYLQRQKGRLINPVPLEGIGQSQRLVCEGNVVGRFDTHKLQAN